MSKTKQKTRIAIVVDRSGSMAGRTLSDHIGGLKTFIKEQQGQVGKTKFTLIQFDSKDSFEVLHDNVNIDKVNVSEIDIIPRGGTPLLDAVGKTIANIAEHESKKKSDDVIIMIITDGHENTSREWTREKLKTVIDEKQKEWTFMFIGAGIDAFADAQSFGIKADQVLNVGNTAKNVSSAYRELTSGKINTRRNLRSHNASQEQILAATSYTANDAKDAGFENKHIK